MLYYIVLCYIIYIV